MSEARTLKDSTAFGQRVFQRTDWRLSFNIIMPSLLNVKTDIGKYGLLPEGSLR